MFVAGAKMGATRLKGKTRALLWRCVTVYKRLPRATREAEHWPFAVARLYQHQLTH